MGNVGSSKCIDVYHNHCNDFDNSNQCASISLFYLSISIQITKDMEEVNTLANIMRMTMSGTTTTTIGTTTTTTTTIIRIEI